MVKELRGWIEKGLIERGTRTLRVCGSLPSLLLVDLMDLCRGEDGKELEIATKEVLTKLHASTKHNDDANLDPSATSAFSGETLVNIVMRDGQKKWLRRELDKKKSSRFLSADVALGSTRNREKQHTLNRRRFISDAEHTREVQTMVVLQGMGRGFQETALNHFEHAVQGHNLEATPYAQAIETALQWAFDIGLQRKEDKEAVEVHRDHMQRVIKKLKDALERWTLYDPFLVHAGVPLISKMLTGAARLCATHVYIFPNNHGSPMGKEDEELRQVGGPEHAFPVSAPGASALTSSVISGGQA